MSRTIRCVQDEQATSALLKAILERGDDYVVRTTGIKDLVQKVNGLLPSSRSKSRNTGSDDRVRTATATPASRPRKARAALDI